MTTTVPVTVSEIAYHCRAAARGKSRALLMADLPFMSYTSERSALDNCARLMQEGLAEIVKVEESTAKAAATNAMAPMGIGRRTIPTMVATKMARRCHALGCTPDGTGKNQMVAPTRITAANRYCRIATADFSAVMGVSSRRIEATEHNHHSTRTMNN